MGSALPPLQKLRGRQLSPSQARLWPAPPFPGSVKVLDGSTKARIFLMTIPKNNWNTDAPDDKKVMHSKVLYDLAERFKFTYVMDMHKYAPIWDDQGSYRRFGYAAC